MMRQFIWMVVLLMSQPVVLHADMKVMPELFKQWTVFAQVELARVDLASCKAIPTSLQGTGEQAVAAQTVVVSDTQLLDLSTVVHSFKMNDVAIVMTTIHVDKPVSLKVGASADWWMSWYVNGSECFSTMKKGNRFPVTSITDHVMLLPLQAGDNLVSVVVKAGSKGWKLMAGSDATIGDMMPGIELNPEDYRDKPFDYIIKEASVRSYTLPEVLKADDGTMVTSTSQWEATRREQLLHAFEKNIYGRIPNDLDKITFETIKQDDNVLDGKAEFRIIRIVMSRSGKQAGFNLNLYTPKDARKAPVFLLANNRHRNNEPYNPDSEFWPARKLIAEGFAAAEINNKELAADHKETFGDGVMQLFPELQANPEGWGAISVWAFGVMRSVDFLSQDAAIDATRICVVGHSRGGKVALWAAANDPRIALVCVNDSGCSGAAIARRKVGETIKTINDQFPHWFNGVYKQYNDREDDLPVDQHELVALVAPRVVCVASAIEDKWADPRGEYLSLVHASPVYALYGKAGMPTSLTVKLDEHVLGDGMSYHIRSGEHGLTDFDWQCYVEAAQQFLKISK